MVDGQDGSKNSHRGLNGWPSQPSNNGHNGRQVPITPRRSKPGSQFIHDPPSSSSAHVHTRPSNSAKSMSPFRPLTISSTRPSKRQRSPSDLTSPGAHRARTSKLNPPSQRMYSALQAHPPTTPGLSENTIHLDDDSPILMQGDDPNVIQSSPAPRIPDRSYPIISPSKLANSSCLEGIGSFIPPNSRETTSQSDDQPDALSGPANMPTRSILHTSPGRLGKVTRSGATTNNEARPRLATGTALPYSNIKIPQLPQMLLIRYFHHTCKQSSLLLRTDTDSLALFRNQASPVELILRQNIDGNWRDVSQPKTAILSGSVLVEPERMTTVYVGEDPETKTTSSRIRLQGPLTGTSHLGTWDIEFSESSQLDKVKRYFKGIEPKVETIERLKKMFEAHAQASAKLRASDTSPNTVSPFLSKPQVNLTPTVPQLVRPRSLKLVDGLRGSIGHENNPIPISTPPATRQEKHAEDVRNGRVIVNESSLTRRSVRINAQPAFSIQPPSMRLPTQTPYARMLDSALRGARKWSQELVYPPAGPRKVTVSYGDLARLHDREFLNDNIIEFYLRYLQEENLSDDTSSFFFNTHFYTILTQPRVGIDYPAIERWTNKEDIFSKDFLVIPINEASHWYLAVVFNLKHLSDFFAKQEQKPNRAVSKNTVGVETGNIKTMDSTDMGLLVSPVNSGSQDHSAVTKVTSDDIEEIRHLMNGDSLMETRTIRSLSCSPPLSDVESVDLLPIPDPFSARVDEIDDVQIEDLQPVDWNRNSSQPTTIPNLSQVSVNSGESLPSVGALIDSQEGFKRQDPPRRSDRFKQPINTSNSQYQAHFRKKTGVTYTGKSKKSNTIINRQSLSFDNASVELPSPLPCIVLLNSLGTASNAIKTVKNIRAYIIEEARAKRSWALTDEMIDHAYPRDLPLQKTSYDCGLYLLYYMQAIMQDWKFALERMSTVKRSVSGRFGSKNKTTITDTSTLAHSGFSTGKYGVGRRLDSGPKPPKGNKFVETSTEATKGNPMELHDDSRGGEVKEVPDSRSGSDVNPTPSLPKASDKSRIFPHEDSEGDVVDLVSDDEKKRCQLPPTRPKSRLTSVRLDDKNSKMQIDECEDQATLGKFSKSSLSLDCDYNQPSGLVALLSTAPRSVNPSKSNTLSDSEDEVVGKRNSDASATDPLVISPCVALPPRPGRASLDYGLPPSRSQSPPKRMATPPLMTDTTTRNNTTTSSTSPTQPSDRPPPRPFAVGKLCWPWPDFDPVRYRLQIVTTLLQLAAQQNKDRTDKLQAQIDASTAAAAAASTSHSESNA